MHCHVRLICDNVLNGLSPSIDPGPTYTCQMSLIIFNNLSYSGVVSVQSQMGVGGGGGRATGHHAWSVIGRNARARGDRSREV